jgi:S-adenosylmethionine:tRNA ribosyltransferase-isomerase
LDSSLFDYLLPPAAIAQTPADRRDQSRLLVIDRRQPDRLVDLRFADIGHVLPAGCDLFRNNAAVFKARLPGRRADDGPLECLLLRPAGDGASWWCLLRPGRKQPVGSSFSLPENASATVVEKLPDGQARVRIATGDGCSIIDIASRHGSMPLPPYIRRAADDPRRQLDAERYQTVYADPARPVAAAAPTAGLHFTTGLDAALRARGHAFWDLTLHVGLGTFQPIKCDRIEQHRMHAEFYEIPAATASRLRDPQAPTRLAVGTTSLRGIEDFLRKQNAGAPPPHPGAQVADSASLFIYPPATFHTQALLTNFHLPRSTLLCLVAAFLTPGSTDGIARIREIYKSALALGYRFYSYGDAMLIL